MLTKDEKRVLDSIGAWRKKKIRTGITPAVIGLVFFPVDLLTDIIVPDSFIEKAARPVMKILMDLEALSESFVSDKAVLEKAREAGLAVKKPADLKKVPIFYLDILARSFFEKNAIYGALQGFGAGAGGYAAVLLDIPTLFTVNLKMISQIGASYGYTPGTDREKEFALRIFAITTTAGDEKEEEMRKMDRLIGSLAKGKFRKDEAITANRKNVLAFTKSVVRWLVKKRSMRGVMFVGMAVGGTLNYFFTKEVAIYAYMFYRKRFLVEKGISRSDG
jgi:hypothetical protein